jgi:hypothetical protein
MSGHLGRQTKTGRVLGPQPTRPRSCVPLSFINDFRDQTNT